MRSVSAKIMAWSLVALLLSLAAFMLLSNIVIGRSVTDSFNRFNSLQLQQARAAYERGGPAELARYLAELERYLHAVHHLTDGAGKDLVTGEDRSAMVALMGGKVRSGYQEGGKAVLGTRSEDGRYRWFVVASPPFSVTTMMPFYLLVFAVVVLLYWLVSTNVASPLKRLTEVVERFGRGDLTARVDSKRKDEIGELGRSFNDMANRIQTLLTAERQLLQDVSHELRSPLARLTFAAEMVRKTPDRDAAASRLRREIDRLSELVRALLDMTRAEGDPSAAEMLNVGLSDLVREITDDCAVEAASRGCRIEVAAPRDVHVTGNPELLRRAIENVIRNAVRYAPADSTVDVKLDESGTISVRDYGPGIPDELLPRIFDPFFRVDPSREESTGGVGLGLAIARRAVRLHDGQITASNAGPGLLVKVSLAANH